MDILYGTVFILFLLWVVGTYVYYSVFAARAAECQFVHYLFGNGQQSTMTMLRTLEFVLIFMKCVD